MMVYILVFTLLLALFQRWVGTGQRNAADSVNADRCAWWRMVTTVLRVVRQPKGKKLRAISPVRAVWIPIQSIVIWRYWSPYVAIGHAAPVLPRLRQQLHQLAQHDLPIGGTLVRNDNLLWRSDGRIKGGRYGTRWYTRVLGTSPG